MLGAYTQWQAGATITDPSHDAFWGWYTGSFQDSDGRIWEVAWNPDWDFPDSFVPWWMKGRSIPDGLPSYRCETVWLN